MRKTIVEAPRLREACPSIVLIVCGIILIGVWSNLLGYSALLLPASLVENPSILSASFTWGRFTAALLFIAFAVPLQRRSGMVGLLVGIILSPIALIMCLAVRQGTTSFSIQPDAILASSAFVSSIGFLVISVPLFILLARIASVRNAALFAMVGIVGECVISSLISTFGSLNAQLIACVLAPVASGICLFIADRQYRIHAELAQTDTLPQENLDYRLAAKSYGRRDSFGSVLMIIQLSFAMVLATSLRFLSTMGPWGLLHEGYLGTQTLSWDSLLLVCFIIIVATLLIFVVPRRLPSQVKCALALIVVLAGLQLAVSSLHTASGNADLLASAAMGCQLFCRVIIWITFMECVRQINMQPLRINGITCLFNVAGSLLFAGASAGGLDQTSIVLMLVYVLLTITIVAIALPFIGMSPDATPAITPAAPKADRQSAIEPSETLSAFAAEHSISAREQQVLALLLDGCTRGQIERLLGLSEGTVRTHVSAVYRKLNVHSKTEMQQMFTLWLKDHAS